MGDDSAVEEEDDEDDEEDDEEDAEEDEEEEDEEEEEEEDEEEEDEGRITRRARLEMRCMTELTSAYTLLRQQKPQNTNHKTKQ